MFPRSGMLKGKFSWGECPSGRVEFYMKSEKCEFAKCFQKILFFKNTDFLTKPRASHLLGRCRKSKSHPRSFSPFLRKCRQGWGWCGSRVKCTVCAPKALGLIPRNGINKNKRKPLSLSLGASLGGLWGLSVSRAPSPALLVSRISWPSRYCQCWTGTCCLRASPSLPHPWSSCVGRALDPFNRHLPCGPQTVVESALPKYTRSAYSVVSKTFLDLFYVYECVCSGMCTSRVHLVSPEFRRGSWTVVSHDGCWEPDPGPLEGQDVLLTTELFSTAPKDWGTSYLNLLIQDPYLFI